MKAGSITAAAAAEFVNALAARHGLTPAELMADAGQLELVPIDAKTARRFREIERAADLRPGAVLDSLLQIAEGWFAADGRDALESWIADGWELSDKDATRAALHALHGRWRKEDAGEDDGGPVDAETLARVIEADRDANERAKALRNEAGGASAILALLPPVEPLPEPKGIADPIQLDASRHGPVRRFVLNGEKITTTVSEDRSHPLGNRYAYSRPPGGTPGLTWAMHDRLKELCTGEPDLIQHHAMIGAAWTAFLLAQVVPGLGERILQEGRRSQQLTSEHSHRAHAEFLALKAAKGGKRKAARTRAGGPR